MKKVRITVNIDEQNADFIANIVKEGKYRSKSHAVEEAINNFKREFRK